MHFGARWSMSSATMDLCGINDDLGFALDLPVSKCDELAHLLGSAMSLTVGMLCCLLETNE